MTTDRTPDRGRFAGGDPGSGCGQPTNTPPTVPAPNGSNVVAAGSAVPDTAAPRYTLTALGCPLPVPTTRSALLSPSASAVATESSAPPGCPETAKSASSVAPSPGNF